MLKEIAMYVNAFGQAADLREEGIIKVFSKDNNEWNIKKELLFKFHNVQKKGNMSMDILNIADALGSCKVFVVKEISDFMYTALDSIGLSTWKMEGDENKILEYVSEKEEEAAEEIKLIDFCTHNNKKQNFNPIEIGDSGYYILGLKDIQEHNMGITTKQALKPFLDNRKFNELIITCTHIPNWLESELKKLNLNFEFSKIGLNDYIIVINHYKN